MQHHRRHLLSLPERGSAQVPFDDLPCKPLPCIPLHTLPLTPPFKSDWALPFERGGTLLVQCSRVTDSVTGSQRGAARAHSGGAMAVERRRGGTVGDARAYTQFHDSLQGVQTRCIIFLCRQPGVPCAHFPRFIDTGPAQC